MNEEKIRELHSNDEDQLDFIFSDAKRIIVTAPAGCGKTTAMVSKIVRELCDGSIENNKKVLSMTFSVNAAIKIKDSLKKLLPEIIDNSEKLLSRVDVSNYHHFALRLLYKYGFSLNPILADLMEFKISDDKHAEVHLIETDAQVLRNFNDAINKADKETVKELIESYWNILNKKLFADKVITYNGILVAAVKLLENENIANFYQKYYPMIIIDEFQDTNLLGFMLVNQLIDENMVIFLGDDIQKIYGFIGAVDGVMRLIVDRFNATQYVFKKNYRFKDNERMKKLDSFIRSYAQNYCKMGKEGSVLLKNLQSVEKEIDFICDGIKQISESTDKSVATLVRAGWQGNDIANRLQEMRVPFFNALYSETDAEFIRFYRVAKEEFHKSPSGKALQKDLRDCLKAIKNRENEIYDDLSRKFVFDSLYHLLDKLFSVSHEWAETAKEKYVDIDFYLENNGLKHMMEYINESVVLTTIHSAKGLEWDYVIVPQMVAGIFPSYQHVCKECRRINGCQFGYSYCETLFPKDAEVLIKDELNAFYVALTRAKKEVFLTVNSGKNPWGYPNKTNCFINLEGLEKQDFDWTIISRDDEHEISSQY